MSQMIFDNYTLDFTSLDELESHLYNCVFHSSENYDSITPDITKTVCDKTSVRQVSKHSVTNNLTSGSKRYWNRFTSSRIVHENPVLNHETELPVGTLNTVQNHEIKLPENSGEVTRNDILNCPVSNLADGQCSEVKSGDLSYNGSDESEAVSFELNDTVVVISDSDNESDVEIINSKIEVVNVDSSDESNLDTSSIVWPEIPNKFLESIQNTSDILQRKKFAKVGAQNKKLNLTFSECLSFDLEEEREENLHTPDSSTNDFIANDVNNLGKNNCNLSFMLLGSDLDLTNKDFLKPTKSAPVVNTDVYETESSCSEAGTVKSQPIFKDISFESPTKEIFNETNLSTFSNFITPVRNNLSEAKQKKKKIVETKASRLKSKTEMVVKKGVRKPTNVDRGKGLKNNEDKSDLEYDSDPTILQQKKGRKKKVVHKIKTKQVKENVNSPSGRTGKKAANKKSERVINSQKNKNKKCVKSSVKIEPVNEKLSDLDNLGGTQKKLSKSPVTPNSDLTLKEENHNDSAFDQDMYFADDAFFMSCDAEEIKLLNRNNSPSSAGNTLKSTKNFSFVDTFKQIESNNTSTCNISNSPDSDTDCIIVELPTINPIPILSDDSDALSDFQRGRKPNRVVKKRNLQRELLENENLILNISVKKKLKLREQNKGKTGNTDSAFKQSGQRKTFSDFFTQDMTKFYDDAWGDEHFDLDQVLSSMTEDDSKWKIVVDDKFPRRLAKRGPRCLRCREFGHVKRDCGRFSGPPKCSFCGAAGHPSTRCPNARCTGCGAKTRIHTQSCSKCAHYHSVCCTLCHLVGHISKNCPDLWRRYHLTTENTDKLNRPESKFKSNSNRWCCNCARRGHFQHTCTRFGVEQYPVSPYILKYSSLYSKQTSFNSEPEDQPVVENNNLISESQENHENTAENFLNFPSGDNNKKALNNIHKSVTNANLKYLNILKFMKMRCKKTDKDIMKKIGRLQDAFKKNVVTKSLIGKVYRLRAQIKA